MYRKHSSLYYIFWIIFPMFVGGIFAWGSVKGTQAAYENLFEKGRTYSFNKEEKADDKKILSEIKDEEKGSDENITLSPIDDLQYSFVDSKTVARAKSNTLLQRIEDSLPKKPQINVTALAYLAADLNTGEIVLEKNKDKILPIASVTKLLTAYVSLETLNQEEVITLSQNAISTYGTSGKLKVGERIRVGDLLYPLLLESSNDAGEALAQSKSRTSFIQAMNDAAEKMGAANTAFEDASGLSPRNVSSAEDLFKIAQYIFKNKKNIFDITRETSHKVKNHTWQNPTILLRNRLYIGGKNGFTDEAERTAVSLFSIPQDYGPNRNIVVIVLKSKDRNKDVGTIVNYIAENVNFPILESTDEEFY